MSLRLRLALWYGIAVLVTVAVVAVVVWLQFSADLRRSLDEALAVQAADTEASLETAGQPLQLAEDPARPGIFTVVLDASGRVLDASRNAPAGLGQVAAGSTTWQPDPSAPTYALEVRDASAGRLVVAGASLDPIKDDLGRLAGLMLLAVTLAAAGSAIGGWWLASRALTPVSLLIDEADRIHAADAQPGRRLPTTGGRDELGRLATTFNRMLDRVEQAIGRQRTFVAAASHDLRTPIAALTTELELARREDATRPELHATIDAALGDARRLRALADDLLGLAAAEDAGREPVLAPVRLRTMVDAAVRHALGGGPDPRVPLELEVDDVTLVTDRVRVEQALANLVANAVRWSSPGGSVTVRVHQVVAPGEAPDPPLALEVDVLDRGPGVDPAAVAGLFVPFSAPRDRNGIHGLGLAAAAEDVRALGGRIGYRDRTGGGAWFWFRVPAPRGAPG